jgi:cytochrome bd-type quinol oxidase subunit 1
LEGLLAFFAESTFIALWLFGRNRLPPLAHTLSICVVSLATIVSAFFILTANAWMQHPVGYRLGTVAVPPGGRGLGTGQGPPPPESRPSPRPTELIY